MTSRPATSVGTGGRCARESVRESPVDGGRREERERGGERRRGNEWGKEVEKLVLEEEEGKG